MIRRFRQIMEDDDGRECEFWCVAFQSETARELALGSVIAQEITRPMPPDQGDEPRPPGRPSFDDVIAAAIEALGSAIDGCESAAAAVHLIRREIARTGDADSIPAAKTVRRYLAEHCAGQKSGQKSGQKFSRGRMARTGG